MTAPAGAVVAGAAAPATAHGYRELLRVIELGSRLAHLAGGTANPTGRWVTKQANQFAWSLHERRSSFRFLIRDRDCKFTRDFDAIFAGEGIKIIKTPVRAPKGTRPPSDSSPPSAQSASTGS